MSHSASIGVTRMACGLSARSQPVQAASELAAQVKASLAGQAIDLACIFFTPHHADAARALAYSLRRRLDPHLLIGMSVETVIAGGIEQEGSPGVSLLAASLPGIDVRPFRITDLLDHIAADDASLAEAAGVSCASAPYRGSILFADPFSVPAGTLLPALAAARARSAPDAAPAPIIGGMASAAETAGENVFILNDEVIRSTGVGISFSGPIRIDPLVSQGCRPIGTPLVVTAAKRQIISSLSGKPALQALTEAIETLKPHERKLCERGILIGRVINEYKQRFGRDDFLIRGLLGVDKQSQALVVADLVRVGQTVQFHVRDDTTASEDLEMLLDAQRLYEPPVGALLFTCTARGRHLFQTPNHDASRIAAAFADPLPAEQQAKPGEAIVRSGPYVPLAGCFAAGEIGPVGDGVFLHAHTACAALFRHA
ncbi:MAG: FIST N-terminal domain-containing protein [Phycisphaerales bacterium]